ncbi:hypothetical protein BI036_gp066 [Morganella phage vB_MmoM_MP1]|uniref:Uncharacterized protein n=1 Tax=Morganella phage vB_MmoM_MP1 TaxID=1852628 RepID=A0A192YAR7_9CAUD|nr:hypothetical protein BI036_gp066 [Morganella phage vB_MmoM_MP1]ANM46622.1 hypothetical protein MP1_gp0066 [Morganella phage vB_MmoM_MP1]
MIVWIWVVLSFAIASVCIVTDKYVNKYSYTDDERASQFITVFFFWPLIVLVYFGKYIFSILSCIISKWVKILVRK